MRKLGSAAAGGSWVPNRAVSVRIVIPEWRILLRWGRRRGRLIVGISLGWGRHRHPVKVRRVLGLSVRTDEHHRAHKYKCRAGFWHSIPLGSRQSNRPLQSSWGRSWPSSPSWLGRLLTSGRRQSHCFGRRPSASTTEADLLREP